MRDAIGTLQYLAANVLLGVIVAACIAWICRPIWTRSRPSRSSREIPSRLERSTPPAKAAEVSTPALTKAADGDPVWPTFDTYTPSRQKGQR